MRSPAYDVENYDWLNRWVGVPYVFGGRDIDRDGGYDCYGLVMAVLREQCGVELPDWHIEGQGAQATAKAVTTAVQSEVASQRACRVNRAQDFDIAVVQRTHLAHHVGLVVAEGVLHIGAECAHGAVYEDIGRFALLRGMPLFYRWERLH